jgi:hypothetical protein
MQETNIWLPNAVRELKASLAIEASRKSQIEIKNCQNKMFVFYYVPGKRIRIIFL